MYHIQIVLDLLFISLKSCIPSGIILKLFVSFHYLYVRFLSPKGVGRLLNKNYGHSEINIIYVSEKSNVEIEDLFTRNDFIKYVLKDKIRNVPKIENSKILKQRNSQYDKVLISKTFFEKIQNGKPDFNIGTKKNFNDLLENINNSLFH